MNILKEETTSPDLFVDERITLKDFLKDKI
jgi:hypothetical protein